MFVFFWCAGAGIRTDWDPCLPAAYLFDADFYCKPGICVPETLDTYKNRKRSKQ